MRRLSGAVAVCLLLGLAVRVDTQQQPQTFAQVAPLTASWTAATAVNTALTLTTIGFSEAVVRLTGVAPLTDGRLIFEGDDGTGTFAWRLAGQRSDASGLSEDQPAIFPQNIAWTVPVSGFVSFRVRLQTAISSSGTATLSLGLTAASVVEPSLQPMVIALQQFTAQLGALQAQHNRIAGIAGSLGRSITSTGDALDVNLRWADPCGFAAAKGNAPISQTANAKVITGTGRRIFICAWLVIGADAENLSLVEGTGTACATGTTAVVGGTTAAAGPNLAANGGWSGGGFGAVAIGDGTDICLYQSGSGRVAGNLVYALQ